MGVIADVRLPAHQFEFGRRLPVDGDDGAEIELVDWVGDGDISIFSLSGPSEQLDGHATDRLEILETPDGRELHVMAWEPNADPFFRLVDEYGGSVRRGTGTEEAWTFETQFPSHDTFASFRSACATSDLGAEVERVYNPTRGTNS